MTTDRWQLVKQIFHASLERTPAQRSSYLDEVCKDDDALRKEVESLIASHEADGDFIDSPAYEVAAEWLANPADSILGRQINHFKILSELGVGGMGEVYLAQDTRLGRKIALKLLPASFANDADRLQRFQQEARSASALNHPNIVTIHEVGEEGGRPYIATELIEGETLRASLASGRMDRETVLETIIQIGSALAAAHDVGIIHRDIKPENIMLRRDRIVKVLDFGLAKLAERRLSHSESEAVTLRPDNTSPGMVMGTINYMSPEQARGLDIDERTDIWSLGVVLYEMLSGKAPFEGATSADITVSILEKEPPALSVLTADIPAELDWIVKKALRKDRDERYQTVKELLGDLRTVKEDLEFEAKLERTVQPSKATPESPARIADQAATLLTNESRTISTDEIREAQTVVGERVPERSRSHRSLRLAALATLVVAIVGVSAYLLFFRAKPFKPFQVGNMVRLTNHGKTTHAAISPDGTYVAYVLSDAGKQSLWIRQTSTANDTQIVPPAAATGYFGVTFSRDGTHLYYVVKANDPGTLYRVPLLGGRPTKLLEKLDSPVTFSPDGNRMAFLRGDYPNRGDSGIFVANADGSDIRQIASRKSPEYFFPNFFTGPSWSSDGKLVACSVVNTKGGASIVAVNVDDGKEQLLTPQPWPLIGRVEWLPDMSGLLVVARDRNTSSTQIFELSYPRAEVRRVTNDLSGYRNLSISDDGNKLMTVQTGGLVNMWIVDVGGAEDGVKLPPGGSDPAGDAFNATQLPIGNVGYISGNETISWTPNGQIVHVASSGRQSDIWVVNTDGSNRKQLTLNAGQNQNPVVSPDGRIIVFTSGRSGLRNVWRMDIDGNDAKQLTNGQSDLLPTISPDGQWVVYSSLTEGRFTLWRVSINGGPPTEILKRDALNPVISPDGKFIAYLFTTISDPGAPPNKVGVIPFEGGEPVKTMDVPMGSGGARTILNWSRDGQSILYTAIESNASNIWSLPLDGGKPTKITNFKEQIITAFDVSRDGKRIAVSRGLLLRDAVMLTNSN